MPNPTGQAKICLRQEKILEIAQNTLKSAGYKCEWISSSSTQSSPMTCSIVLGSWNAYLKHLLQHVQHQWNKTGKYVCRLPRCNLPMRGVNVPFDQLRDHIESSHLSRVSLYCPFRGCEGLAFSRGASQLEIHVQETHSNILNQIITVPSNLVLPMSVPYFPLPIDPPPPLPSPPMLGWFVPTVRGARIRRIEGPPLSQASPRKQLKLHQMAEEEDPETSSELSSNFFDDFDKQLDKNGQFKGRIRCVLGQKAGPRFDVARPQPILDPRQFGPKLAPTSIHYNVFSDRFDEMERATELRVTMPIVPISTTQASSMMH